MNRIDKFTIVTGSIGIVADTITILAFAAGAGLIVPTLKGFDAIPGGAVLFTGVLGFYSSTMIVWFLFRRKSLNPETRTFGFDDLQKDDAGNESVEALMTNLLPIGGVFFRILANRSARVIFWLAFFIDFAPATLWFYIATSNAAGGFFFGTLSAFVLAQFSTFFALVLDKFFRTIYVDFSS